MFPWNIKYPNVNNEILNLDWVINTVKGLVPTVESLVSWRTTHEAQYEELMSLYDEVKADWDAFAAGEFPPSTYEALRNWIQENSIDLIGEMVKMVFFGLTDDGYFVAYIPDTWDSIEFNTIVAPGENYGRLVIEY